jgi:hypothetical protein
VGLVAAVALGAAGSAATGFASASPLLTAGPRLMVSALGLLVGAALELWWLAALAVLAAAR